MVCMDHLCGRCNEARDESAFYVRHGKVDTAWCKPCYRAWYVARREHHIKQNTAAKLARRGGRAFVSCQWCGKEISTTGRSAPRRKHCSTACKKAATHDVEKRARAEAKPERACRHCGRQMPRTMRIDAKFCSAECNSAAHQLVRKLAKRVGSPPQPLSRALIFERDNWRCGLCGGEVNPDLRHPHPMCGSVDHIVPVSRGGSNELDNLQLAHLRCNLRKRDKQVA